MKIVIYIIYDVIKQQYCNNMFYFHSFYDFLIFSKCCVDRLHMFEDRYLKGKGVNSESYYCLFFESEMLFP